MPTARRRRQSVPTMKSITRRRTSGTGLPATPKRRFVNPMDQYSKMPGTAIRGAMEPQLNRGMAGNERDLRMAARMPNRGPIGIPKPKPGYAPPLPGTDPRPVPGPRPNLNRVDPDTLGAGRDPLEHQRYWANQGYLYQPNEARPGNDWVQRQNALARYMAQQPPPIGNPPGPPNNFPGPRPNPGPPISPNTPAGGQAPPPGQGPPNPNAGQPQNPGGGGPPGSVTPDYGTPPAPGAGGNNPPTTPPGGGDVPPAPGVEGLPLDPYFEAQRRVLDDQLAGRMGALNPMEAQIMAMQAQQNARLGTNENLQKRSMLESLAGRGAFGGGIQRRDEGNLATDFMRQRQDVATGTAGQLSDVALQRSGAQNDYQAGLMEALMALAQRQATSEYAPTPTPDTDPRVRENPPKMPKRPKNRRKPPKGGGGGGGGKKNRRRS